MSGRFSRRGSSRATDPGDGIKVADLKRLRDVYRDRRHPVLLEHAEAVLAEREQRERVQRPTMRGRTGR